MRASVLRIAFSLLLLSQLGQWASGQEPKKIASVEGVTEYRLDNGVRVLLIPDPAQPKVTVNMTVLVGSRHEGYGETGMAHLLEHMVFRGTPSIKTPDIDMRDRGATFNGTTNFDRTNYYETLPATPDNLEFAIRFEADRLVNCFIRREDLLAEMTVVRNEFEQGENSPEQLLSKRLMSTAFEWHNYGKSTIGNRSDIERVPIENLQDFYRRYYQPDNIVVIIGGKFDEAAALQHVQKYFGAIPRPTRKLNATYTEEPPQDGERKVELRRVGEVGLVEAIYHVPASAHEDFAALEVLGSILMKQPSGRLYKSLVETNKASQVAAFAYDGHDPTVFDVTLSVRKENSLDEARDIMLKTIDEVIAKGVTPAEVERAQLDFRNARRRIGLSAEALVNSLSDWAAMGDWRLYFLHRDRVEKVTPADVQRVAAKYLTASNRTLGYFIPSATPALVTVPAAPDAKGLVAEYKGRPPVATVPDFDYSLANVESKTQRSKLAGGIKVAVLPKPTRDEQVNLLLTLRYGNAENLKELRTAADLLPALMERGTKRLSYEQLQDEKSRLDVQINGSGALGRLTWSVRTRRSTLPQTIALLREILREPALEDSGLAVVRPERIATLEERLTDPQFLASNLRTRLLLPYPAGDVRRPLSLEEQIAGLKAVTIEQVRRLHSEFLGGANGELTIVGDFDPAPALQSLGQFLNDWQPKQPYARIASQAFLSVPAGRHVVQAPDKASAVYAAGESLALSDQDADYAPLMLGDFIFGSGGLASRLNDRIRQREGLSYGIFSNLIADQEDKVGRYAVSGICNPENIGKVETAVREEFQKFVTAGIPTEEYTQSQAGLLKERDRSRSSDAEIARLLQERLRLDQTLAFEMDLDKRLATLSSADVIAAWKRHLDPSRLVVVVAGSFSEQTPKAKTP